MNKVNKQGFKDFTNYSKKGKKWLKCADCKGTGIIVPEEVVEDEKCICCGGLGYIKNDNM